MGMENEFEEYTIFSVKTSTGEEVEMAVVDEFECNHKTYVVGALIKDDMIDDEGRYIYRAIIKGDDFDVEMITDEKEYEDVTNAYMEMEP